MPNAATRPAEQKSPGARWLLNQWDAKRTHAPKPCGQRQTTRIISDPAVGHAPSGLKKGARARRDDAADGLPAWKSSKARACAGTPIGCIAGAPSGDSWPKPKKCESSNTWIVQCAVDGRLWDHPTLGAQNQRLTAEVRIIDWGLKVRRRPWQARWGRVDKARADAMGEAANLPRPPMRRLDPNSTDVAPHRHHGLNSAAVPEPLQGRRRGPADPGPAGRPDCWGRAPEHAPRWPGSPCESRRTECVPAERPGHRFRWRR